MENRKSLRVLIFISVFISTLGISPSALAYGVETHAYLTDQVIDFYNKNYSNNPIRDDLKSYIIDGARREDDTPRWMNHFYDPVNNRGLNDPEWGRGFSSKKWAQSDSEQTTYAYKPISYMASILTASEQGNVNDMDLNFTWAQAIRYYRDGEIEKAMFILGHVIHLIEDASVPDHTRNDAHPHPLGDGSPYEEYTEKFTRSTEDKELIPRLSGKKPIDSHPALSSYFDVMANYSNNNFYSEDTIDKIYNLPISDGEKIVGQHNYLLKRGEDVYLLARKDLIDLVLKTYKDSTLRDDLLLADYWSHLSTKSIQVGAGVIKLFFDDIERVNYGDARLVKDDRNPITWAIDNARAFAQIMSSSGKAATSSIINTSREAFTSTLGNGSTNNEKLVETIDVKSLQKSGSDLKKGNNTENAKSSKSLDGGKLLIQANNDPVIAKQESRQEDSRQMARTVDEEKEIETIEKAREPEQQKIQVKKEVQQKQVVSETQQEPSFKECSFNTAQPASNGKVVINEVAWMGGSSDFGLTSTDEWIELKNVSNSEVDVSNWQLIDKAEQIKINLSSVGGDKIVKSGQFILLERTDDNSVPNVPADLIYSNTLNNSDEGVRLFDSQCNLVDGVLANPDWPAGDNIQKRTMERSLDLSWHTYNGTAQNSIFGTPKKENSAQTIVYSGGGGGGSVIYPSGGSASTSTNNQQQTVASGTSSPSKILISEIQITGGTGKTENDFIELYNPNSTQVNLNGYRLVKRTKTGISDTSIKSWTTDVYIPANGYYLWANSGYTDIPATSDVVTTATVSNDNGVAIRYGAEDTGAVIDSVAWGGAENIFIEGSVFPTNPGVNESIQRKFTGNTFIDTDNNASDFEIQTCPSPKAQSRSCPTVNQTPSVLLPLSIIEVIYNPEGTDEGKELVRINNPNSEEVNVSSYSLQYLGSDGDFAKIKKKNFGAENKIPDKGIFRIGMNCSGNTPCENVDMSWSEALNNSLGTVFLVSNQELLTGLSDSDIVHGFHYPEATPLSELSNLVANYDSNKLTLNLSWDANPSLVYQIQEYNSPGVTIFEGKGGSFSKSLDEVGRNYKFSIQAFNENGERTGLIEKEVSAPSFIKDARFYNATHYTNQGNAQDNLIEFSYNSYPFLPLDLVYTPQGIPTSGPNYKILVFYLNAEAPKRAYLNGSSPLTEDISNVLGVKYATCSYGESNHNSLLLPDTVEKCNVGGGFGNGSMEYTRYLTEGDKHMLFSTNGSFGGQSIFTESDYFTVGFYGFQRDFPQGTAPMDGIYPNFKLLAVDKTKHHFNSAVVHQPPQLTGNIAFNFDKQNSKLNISWPSATDPDTIDGLLTYEIKYISSGDWQPAGNSVTKIVSASDNFSISVRAKDDFGNYSTPALTAEWSYPAVDFVFAQNENNTWSSSFGLGYGYYGSDGNGISLQSITSIVDYKFDKISLRVRQLPVGNDAAPNDYANLKLSVYPNNNNQPDFSSLTASSVIANIYNPDGNADLTFHFVSPATFSANSKFWLALEVESYSDSRGFSRNEWRNAVINTNPYSQGEAASVRVKTAGGAYSYGGFAIEPNNDWYVKIGLER
ncbi:MAG: lamin tail domain-containing protein [Candidatus Colwellbacteria bacterium]|nr:lamin tail domain-containing protein [Candidatus Colwellbacteria bacterium]